VDSESDPEVPKLYRSYAWIRILNTVPKESSSKISRADGSLDDDTEFDAMETESSRR
jgi:hypothetical protein